MYFHYNYFLLKRKHILQSNELKFPSAKDALCHLWLKLAQWFWRRFLNFIYVYWLIRYHLLLEKGLALHLCNLEFTSFKDAFSEV